MKQCLRIILSVESYKPSLKEAIQKAAKKTNIEGTIQKADEKQVIVFACGPKLNVDNFLDELHNKVAAGELDCLEIEPFLKDRDFRGVFRVIE